MTAAVRTLRAVRLPLYRSRKYLEFIITVVMSCEESAELEILGSLRLPEVPNLR